MSELPDYEVIERVLETEPQRLLEQLPDNTERRRAKDHLDLAYRYAKDARERRADR